MATYRLQFNRHFTLRQAAEIVDYLRELGVGDCYCSPLLAARPGSLHGYDVIDPTKLNPELGTREDFNRFASLLAQRGMGLIMDVVPNHMCIAGSGNQWWNDVLENGPGSPFASFFDIDWRPPKQNLEDKVLLPVLGDQYGRVLENQEIQLAYQRGAFFANYYETRLPIAPRTSILILRAALEAVTPRLEESDPHRLELESIITALEHLPPRTETDPEKVKERRREKEIAKRRLAALVTACGEINRALKQVIRAFNGEKGVPHSFDRLEELLAEQAYRLCFWRVAADEINYRRFFDINELAAIRVEQPEVFAAVHDLILRLMKEGHVTGLRVDHIDGLYDPEQYLLDLQCGCRKALRKPGQSATRNPQSAVERPCYIVVEKILGRGERLRESWAAMGTTGYDFLNLVNGVFVETRSEGAFRKLYRRSAGAQENFADVAYESKKLILRSAMSGELHVLARRLDRTSEQSRYSRDFTLNNLQDALGEVIACFPIYRSYIRPNQTEAGEEDRRRITAAVRHAKRRNPTLSASIFDFIQSLLLLNDPEGLDDEQRRERREFVLRFQQLTGPVTAKGVEDTAFYRFHLLASLCEVGGEPDGFGVSVETFHEQNQARQEHWPHTMLTTSTHDTKRSEDVRARINVLSEIPARWYRAVRRWQNLNRDLKTMIEDSPAPDANEEYLLYQTLIGAWPFAVEDDESRRSFVNRIQEYLVKAVREAKIHSSWLNHNEEYEQAVRDFVARLLAAGGPFINDFVEFQAPIARAGMFNSLSQTLLKIAAPGVPDFYQGSELWDFSLVDPDNRRPVDYERRKQLLAELRASEAEPAALARDLMRDAENGKIKLFVTSRALNYRLNNRELFERGEYLPLKTAGENERHVVAFARRLGERTAIVIATRFFSRLIDGSRAPVGGEVWGDTAVVLNEELADHYRDIFTGERICAQGHGLPLAEACAHLPLALLEHV